MKLWINAPLLILQSLIMATLSAPRRISSTRIKAVILLGLFCVLETTGLESINRNRSSSPSTLEEVEGYDPVESYYQLRRHYLTSTARGDGSPSSSSSSWASNSKNSKSLKQKISSGGSQRYDHHHHHHHYPRREHLYHQNSQTYNNHHTQVDYQQNPSNNFYHPDSESHHNNHRCYVCLPPNKGSREARDILAMFSTQEEQEKIADCALFGQHNVHEYEFPCPPTYGGCILRIHGPNISRACSRYRLNDCKRANAVEFCYCTQPLCNDIKQEPIRLWQRGQREDGESDDEDDSSGSSGDGGGSPDSDDDVAEPPSDSGVVHQYTTTTLDSVPLANFNSEDEIIEVSNFSISNQASYLFCRLSSLSSILLSLLPFYLFS